MFWLMALLACGGDLPPPEPVFVRDGVVQAAGAEGRELPDGRKLVELRWTPGQSVATIAGPRTAPQVAECVELFRAPLGDLTRHTSLGATAPDTALSFSPDGRWLAVGTYTGEILVLDGWTGAVRARRRLAETLVKRVAWAPDGQTVYAAEQSPDALIHALDPTTLASRATARLADHVRTSAPPPGEDLYGVYSLPAAYGLHVLPDGDLIVAATHGWDEGGRRLNRARLLRLRPDLTQVAAWPEDEAADAVFRALHVSGEAVAVPVGRSADGPAPDLPIGGVAVLDLSLKPVREVRIDPLKPWFDDAFVWEAVALGDQGALAVGLGDGRVVVDGRTYPLGAPVMAGDVPIAASVGQIAWPSGEEAPIVAVTSYTNIPWGAARPELRPPEAHPGANALTALRVGERLSVAWTWRGPHALQGLTLSEDGETLVVGAGARQTDARADLFGALVFDLRGEAAGDARLRAWCATEGPVFFRHAITADGRVAVAEHPWLDGERVRGAYRVTVFR